MRESKQNKSLDSKSNIDNENILISEEVSVFDRILEILPESPPYYPKDQLTDKPERFFVNEAIREKIL